MRNNRYETVKFLLAQGANVNDRIPDGTSALSMAILNADFDLAALLLESGADPNAPDPRGHPLHVVVWMHQPGAPPDFAMNGEDPRPVPRPRGKLSHLDIARLLLAKGADPNAAITWAERRFGSGGVARKPVQPEHRAALPVLRGRHAVLPGGAQRRRRRRRQHDAWPRDLDDLGDEA